MKASETVMSHLTQSLQGTGSALVGSFSENCVILFRLCSWKYQSRHI